MNFVWCRKIVALSWQTRTQMHTLFSKNLKDVHVLTFNLICLFDVKYRQIPKPKIQRLA